MGTDREKGTGNKRERVTRGSRNPKHGKRKHYIVHKLGARSMSREKGGKLPREKVV
jgi:hypothetical protein